MTRAPDILDRRLNEILRREKRKRIEAILATALFYSLLAALLAQPFCKSLSPGALRWFLPAIFICLLGPFLFLKRRWRHADSVRALARADRALRLDERALTAWELLQRGDSGTAALLVFKEAGERLANIDTRTLFRRSWSREAYFILPLAAVWAVFLWFDPSFEFGGGDRPLVPALAQELRTFSRQLQEKAKSNGLRESLRLGEELEKVAQKALQSNAGNERLKTEVAGTMKKFDLAGKAAAQPQTVTSNESEQSLMDLKAELEASRDIFSLPNGAQGTPQLGQEWLERLPAMPQLKRQLDQGATSQRNLSQKELQSLLERMDRQVTGELDRRTLLDAQQVLERMMKQGSGERGEQNVQMAGRGEAKLEDGALGENNATLPGTEPGKKTEELASLPEIQGGAATHLKGSLGAGESSGLLLKGKPSAGKSKISQDEIIASYRRQAEAELNSERVPEALKETIKQYFLSLSGDARR
ncbi:MAG: hypothetical protein ACM3TN_24385 [Alphaproteobacteria bacterium]